MPTVRTGSRQEPCRQPQPPLLMAQGLAGAAGSAPRASRGRAHPTSAVATPAGSQQHLLARTCRASRCLGGGVLGGQLPHIAPSPRLLGAVDAVPGPASPRGQVLHCVRRAEEPQRPSQAGLLPNGRL